MKPFTQVTNFFKLFHYLQSLEKCERKSNGLRGRSWFGLSSLNATGRVSQATKTGRAAFTELVSNKYHLVGVLFLVVGFCASNFYHFLNAKAITDPTWFFINWYYFFFAIREEVLIGFWSVGTFLLLPRKYTLSFIPCTVLLAWSITTILNYSLGITFQVSSLSSKSDWDTANKGFHNTVSFDWWVIGFSLAIGFVISMDYLVYRWAHLRTRPFASLFGIIKTENVPAETIVNHARTAVNEIENFQSRI